MTTWQVTTSTVTFVRLHDELFKYYRARVDQTADAEDMVGETWLAAGRLFEKRSSLRKVVYAVVRRLVAQYWRGKGRRLPPSDAVDTCCSATPSPDDLLVEYRMHRVARQALKSIPAVYREAVCLWLDGRDHFEIALEFGIGHHTARSRVAWKKQALCATVNNDNTLK